MLRNAVADLRTGIIAFVAFSVLLGLGYPYLMTGLAQGLFHRQANGSLVEVDGQTVGSSLVGQNFSNPAYFHQRPSAAGSDGYDASASSGSNLGPSSQALADRVEADVARIREENNLPDDAEIPVDAVTASASGLDPHISPAYAQLQVARVADARGVSATEIARLVDDYTDGSTLGAMGEPRVNVLLLNIALDKAYEAPAPLPTAEATSTQ
jgi:K+-transporting ATPase ATPase C chain